MHARPELTHTSKLEHFRGEVLEDRGCIHGSLRTYAHVVLSALLEVPVNTADGELRDKRGDSV